MRAEIFIWDYDDLILKAWEFSKAVFELRDELLEASFLTVDKALRNISTMGIPPPWINGVMRCGVGHEICRA